MNKKLFLSTVSSEFELYRQLLAKDLKRTTLDVAVQEDFGVLGDKTLMKLDAYIQACDGVIHLIGKATGALPGEIAVKALLAKYPDFATRLPALADALKLPNPGFSYTQWEAYLGIYHRRPVFIYWPTDLDLNDLKCPRGPRFVYDAAQEKAQREHYARIDKLEQDRGEFANEERLSSAVLRDLVHILPALDHELDVPSSKLRHTAERLIGRDTELTMLDAAWNDEHRNLVVVRGKGGEGKTSLVGTWMAELALKGWRGAEYVYDWSFYSQGTDDQRNATAELFINEALEYFGDANPDLGGPTERGGRLAKLVAAKRCLLVLDGLEPLQYPPGAMHGMLKDPGMAALLRGLVAKNKGLCVITTREKVDEIKHHYGKSATDHELDFLTKEAGAALLHYSGAQRAGDKSIAPNDPELQTASEEVHGHALTLALVGQYLKLTENGDIRHRDRMKLAEADAEYKNDATRAYGHAFKAMEAYETWFAAGDEQAQRQLAILRLLGLFDRAASKECLAALRAKPAISGLTEPLVDLTQREWNIAVSRLGEIDLVGAADDGSLDCHPLLREYFAMRLKQGSAPSSLALSSLALQSREERLPTHQSDKPTSTPHDSALATESRRERPATSEEPRTTPPDSALESQATGTQPESENQTPWREAHSRLFDHLCQTTEHRPATLPGLQPLYQAVTHGCLAGRQQETLYKVYIGRILRGTGDDGFYSTKKLGAIGADLGAVAAFFDVPWSQVSPNLNASDQAWLLAVAAFNLRALGRLTEALEPLRVSLNQLEIANDWKRSGAVACNLSELELTLGRVSEAVEDGRRSIDFADRSGDTFLRMALRTTAADALHQAGQRAEAQALFGEAERMQAEDQPQFPLLYSQRGFRYADVILVPAERAAWRTVAGVCDPGGVSLLQSPVAPASTGPMVSADATKRIRSGVEDPSYREALEACAEATRRATQTHEWAITSGGSLLDIAFDRLTRARASLYRALLEADPQSAIRNPKSEIALALSALRQANQIHLLPLALLTAAMYYGTLGGDLAQAEELLTEAQEIAERGPMPLFLADVHLHRARLFCARDHGTEVDPRAELAKARALIDKHGYERRRGELEDAEFFVLGC